MIELCTFDIHTAELAFKWRKNPQQRPHLRTGWRNKSIEEQKKWYDTLDSSKSVYYAFDTVTTGGGTNSCAGYVCLENIDWHDRRAEIGGMVGNPKKDNKLLIEAWRLLIKEAFGILGLVRIDAVSYTCSQERGQLVKDLGFKLEGTKKNCHYWDNKWHDELIWGLVKK